MRRSFMVMMTLFTLSVAGCGRNTPQTQNATSEHEPGSIDQDVGVVGQSAEGAEGAENLCLPLVSGCGCAYACGASADLNADGTYQVTRVGGGSGPAAASVERWCFGSTGLGRPDPGSEGSDCKDVFYDRTPCGGECIPTTDFLGCHLEDEQCVP